MQRQLGRPAQRQGACALTIHHTLHLGGCAIHPILIFHIVLSFKPNHLRFANEAAIDCKQLQLQLQNGLISREGCKVEKDGKPLRIKGTPGVWYFVPVTAQDYGTVESVD